jgi:acyl-CoA synthetase (NDP forming)
MEKVGLRLPPLPREVEAELRRFLPLAGAIFGNPVDATTLLFPDAMSATMRALGDVPEIDMLVYHLGFHPVSRWGGALSSSPAFLRATIDALTEARRATSKPVLLALRPPPDLEGAKDFFDAQEAFVGAGFPVFHSLRQAGAAMARIVAWQEVRLG